MPQSTNPARHDSTRARGYPLIALFLLVTVSGVIAALAAPLARSIFRGDVAIQSVLMAAVATGVFGGSAGAVIGLFHVRPGIGLTLGTLVGGIIGFFAGSLVWIPRESFGSVFFLSFVGSIIIVLVAAVFRLNRR